MTLGASLSGSRLFLHPVARQASRIDVSSTTTMVCVDGMDRASERARINNGAIMHSAAKKIVHWMFAGVLAAAGSLASAFPVNVNLVGNPGFESGDASWDPTGNAIVDGAAARSGGLGLFFRPGGPDGPTGMARQSFTLLSNEEYTLDFYLNGNISALEITFNGVGLATFLDTLDIDVPDPAGWVFYTGTFSGKTGGELKFNFNAGTSGDGLFLDDVNLACIDNCSDTNGNPMPEPGSLLLVGAALSALAIFRRRRTA